MRKIIIVIILFIAVCAFAQAPDWQWAAYSGGTDWDEGYAITIDDAGNTYVTGFFTETATFGSYSLTCSGGYDIFVAKMDAVGNWLWATKAGGTVLDEGYAITIDDAGNSYVTGYFMFTATFGSYSLTSSGGADIFVAKMDANGNWQWASRAGGTVSDIANTITIDNAGNTYVTGYFEGTANFGSYSLTSNGLDDIFVAKMDSFGNWLWATQAGGIDYDRGYAITIDDAGNSYVIGGFIGTATFGSYSLTSSGAYDIFVAKLNSSVFAENEIIPLEMGLSNYPNPFKPSGAGRSPATTISFSTTESTESTELFIYNIKGQKIKTLSPSLCHPELVEGRGTNNQYSITWNGTDENNQPVCSGIYLYKLVVNNKTKAIKKMILLR